MTIKRLLQIMVGISLIPTIAAFVFLHWQVDNTGLLAEEQKSLINVQSDLLDKQNNSMQAEASIAFQLSELHSFRTDLLNFKTAGLAVAVTRRTSEIEAKDVYLSSLLIRLDKLDLTGLGGSKVNGDIREKLLQFDDLMSVVIKGLSKRNKRPATKKFLVEAQPLSEEISAEVDRLVTAAELQSEQRRGDIKTSRVSLLNAVANVEKAADEVLFDAILVRKTLLGCGIFLAFFLPLSGWFVSRKILSPLQIQEREISRISDSRDLSIDVPAASGEIGRVSSAFNRLNGAVRELISNAVGSASHFQNASQEISAAAADTARGVAEQDTSSGVVYDKLCALTEGADQAETYLNNASEHAEENFSRAESGGVIIGNSINAVIKLADGINKSSEELHIMGVEMKNVHGILAVIEDISSQTNLLALNAAIEAARAGEHGRGFSVVADEVRNLSLQTEKAALEVRSILDAVIAKMDSVITIMDAESESAEEVSKSVATAQESLSQITGSSKKNHAVISEALASIKQQKVLTIEATQNLKEVNRCTETTAATAEQLAAAAKSNLQEVDDLNSVLTQFKI